VIEDQHATTLRDVLRNVPGISFQAGEGGVPAGDQMSIRGNPARTDIFIDGVRDVGGYTRDSFNVEQVEVFKGPNSAYSGRGSTGGSVNLISKTPKLNPFYDAGFSYGSHDYYRGTIDVNQPLGQFGLETGALRLNALFHDQDFSGRDYVHDNRWALNPTFALGLGANTRAILSYLHLQEDNTPSYGHPFVNNSINAFGGAAAVGKIAPIPFHRFFGLIDRDYEKIANDIAGLRLEHDFTPELRLINQTRYGRTDRDSIITAPRFVLDPATDPEFGPNDAASGNAVVGSDGTTNIGLNHQVQSRDQVTEIISNQTDFRVDSESDRFKNSLVTSLEVSHEREENYLRATPGFPFPAQTSDPTNPDPSSPFHPVVRTGARNLAEANAGGISVFDTLTIHEKWIVSAGIRGDVFSVDYEQRDANGSVTVLDRTDVEPTWRGGLVYKPLPNGSIFFGYGTSFNPSAEGLTLSTNGANNVNLPPERAASYELGTKWDLFENRLSVSAALFRSDKTDVRHRDPTTDEFTGSGDHRVQGVEFGISGQITRNWNVYGGYTFTHSEITRSRAVVAYDGRDYLEEGNRIQHTPEQTASISTTYELPYRITIGTSFFFVDQRFSNNIETQGVPGYWLQDALLSWRANDHIDFRVNVSNLWDEKYIDRVGGGHAIPGVGRTVIGTVALKF
jgi:catecholate siderophore receptor